MLVPRVMQLVLVGSTSLLAMLGVRDAKSAAAVTGVNGAVFRRHQCPVRGAQSGVRRRAHPAPGRVERRSDCFCGVVAGNPEMWFRIVCCLLWGGRGAGRAQYRADAALGRLGRSESELHLATDPDGSRIGKSECRCHETQFCRND